MTPPDDGPHVGLPSQNEQAERYVAGALYVGKPYARDLVPQLDPKKFHLALTRKVVEAARQLVRDGRPIDRTTIAEQLGNGSGVSLLEVEAALDEVGRMVATEDTAKHWYGQVVQSYQNRGLQVAVDALHSALESGDQKAIEHQIEQLNHLRHVPYPLSLVTGAQLMEAAKTDIKWVVSDLFTEGSVRIISGPGKSGKTTLAVALGLAMVSGRSVGGTFHSDGGKIVIYFDGENRMPVWSRKFHAVARGLDLDPVELVNQKRFVYVNPRTNGRTGLYLDDPATLQEVIRLAKDVDADEIVLDSLTRIHAKNENDAGEMNQFFIGPIFLLRDEVGAGVTILHHCRKPLMGSDDPGASMRGSSDLRNITDCHLSIRREPRRKDQDEPPPLRLEITAQREAEEGPPWYMALKSREDGALVFEAVERGSAQLRQAEVARDEILAHLEEQGEAWSQREAIFAAVVLKGLSRRTVERALSELSSGLGARVEKNTKKLPYGYRIRPR